MCQPKTGATTQGKHSHMAASFGLNHDPHLLCTAKMQVFIDGSGKQLTGSAAWGRYQQDRG